MSTPRGAWTSGRLQALGYVLGSAAAGIVAVVAVMRPRSGPVLLGIAIVLMILGGVAIWLSNARGGTR